MEKQQDDTSTKKFNPEEMQQRAQQMISAGTMPSLEDFLKAVGEVREEMRPDFVKAKETPSSQKGR